ncbi:MAG: winged helix-turn-helix domain-containing protein, partial [Aeromonas veronii]
MISLNESSGELIWDGTVISQLSSSEIQVLQCLLERPDELVEKEILLEAGWPSKVVQQNSLTVAIKNIRKALAEITDGPIIET